MRRRRRRGARVRIPHSGPGGGGGAQRRLAGGGHHSPTCLRRPQRSRDCVARRPRARGGPRAGRRRQHRGRPGNGCRPVFGAGRRRAGGRAGPGNRGLRPGAARRAGPRRAGTAPGRGGPGQAARGPVRRLRGQCAEDDADVVRARGPTGGGGCRRNRQVAADDAGPLCAGAHGRPSQRGRALRAGVAGARQLDGPRPRHQHAVRWRDVPGLTCPGAGARRCRPGGVRWRADRGPVRRRGLRHPGRGHP